LFDNFFNKDKSENSNLNRIILIDEDQLDEILNSSIQKTILIFKHSTRCGVSSMALKRFEKKISKSTNDFDFYYLDILKNRNLSNSIATKFNVYHESPQLLVIKNKQLIAHASHFDILDVSF